MEVIHIKTFLKGLLATAIGILLTTLEFGLVISFIAAIVFLVNLLPSIVIGLRVIGILILLLILLLWIGANSVEAYRKLNMGVESD
ncbi:hypothetical protein K413DRAFT_4607 [Clostridium sp. ASBs410]|nr:hypothetical protein K413DRAFT_4607 [Clostridium sp. ASBs410]